ncbi:dihydropteroate synthase [uncultured Treponema sp.]|uniref:dihydropteroate synthase n=1 Tax=uncultured Treponema sp. TaxID=162155 RepID=UPI0015BBE743|nr:dihydropteroate synthase [uncultured Treponema sp.]
MISLKLADRIISTEKPALVMGIVNATPDSFWEKSRGGAEMALRQIEEGADIIDLGAESTRPGSHYVSEDEQIERLVPVLREIRRHSDIPVSIDTRKSAVMKACLDEGADILNDVSALEDDGSLAGLCAAAKIPVILMHKRLTPDVMQDNTDYADVFKEVDSYLSERVEYALKQGISSDKIILDPGIGFGKNTADNCTLIKKCGQLCTSRYPVLMALSRKTVIGQLCGREVQDRLAGTLAADLLAVLNGASLVRVHDVRETVDSLNVLKGIGA